MRAHRKGAATRSVWLALIVVAALCIVGAAWAFSGSAGPALPAGEAGAGETPTTDSARPPRIAALLPFAADQLLSMGVEPVAVPAVRGGAPEAWEGLATVQLDHSAGPNIEQLIAVDPDVIVASAVYAQFFAQMERATSAEILVMDVDTMADVPGHLRTLGALVGREPEAAALASGLPAPAAAGADPVGVLAVFGTPHAFYAFLPDSYLGDVVGAAGGRLVTDDLESHTVFRGLAPLSMEAVLKHDPDLLLVVFHGEETSARAMLERDPLWSGLEAVKRGRVGFLRDDLYAMRPGSEMGRALAEIRTLIEGARADAP